MRSRTRAFAAVTRAGLLASFLGAAALLTPAGAAAATVSSNWAGYVAHAPSGRFTSVSAEWTAPAASCTAGRETHSAVWVGLGGYRIGARALEQIGTEADCTPGGRAIYSSWVELLPAGAVSLRLAVHPGDRVAASVTVIGRDATLRLRDLTTARRYSTTRRLRAIDVSTADWIVEAPSGCDAGGGCRTLALANFGSVSFANATATSRGRLAAISSWSAGRLLLRQRAGASNAAASSSAGVVAATPTALEGSSFAVAYGELEGAAPEAPVLPGFAGGQ